MKITYNFEDDKIRIFFEGKPDAETIESLKKLGFKWAPLQKCWFAVWSIGREKFAEKLGDIEVDQIGLIDRALAKAERLNERADKNLKSAQELDKKTSKMGVCQTFGQPILVGHHSEKRHRKDLETVRKNMNAIFALANSAKSNSEKAEDCLTHAQHLRSEGAIQRRIKKIQAEIRASERIEATIKNRVKILNHFLDSLNLGKDQVELWASLKKISDGTSRVFEGVYFYPTEKDLELSKCFEYGMSFYDLARFHALQYFSFFEKRDLKSVLTSMIISANATLENKIKTRNHFEARIQFEELNLNQNNE
jgi:hypothetical protein